MQLNAFKQKLKEATTSDKIFNDRYTDLLYGNSYKKLNLDGLEIKLISSERHNSDYVSIFSYDEKFYELVGHYDSWNGIDFNDKINIYEVVPEQKTITIYRRA